MSIQIPLALSPQLIYSASSFLVHHGVSEIIASLEQSIKRPEFCLHFIQGQPRSGKTHLALRIHALARESRAFPRIIEGEELATWIQEQEYRRLTDFDEPIVVDNSDLYLLKLKPGDSGPFVAFSEHVRSLGGTIILHSTKCIGDFSVDDHILSRLKAGKIANIGNPDELDLVGLLGCMARQRGLNFDRRKADFLYKRLPKSIPEIESYLDNLLHLASLSSEKIDYSVLGDAL